MNVIMKAVSVVHKGISHLMLWIATLLMGLMSLSVLMQILMRYIFNNPISWVEEFSVFSMFLLVFLAAPYLILYKCNVSMTLFYDKIHNRVAKLIANLFLHALVLYSCIRFLPGIMDLVISNEGVMSPQMPITKGQLYSIVPVSFFLMATITVQQIVEDIVGFVRGKEEETA